MKHSQSTPETPTPEQQQAQVLEFIEVLGELYTPSQNVATATHMLSTEEIYNAIKDINPGAQISKDSVYQAMIQSGYIYRPRPGSMGIDMKWLLQAK